MKRKIHYNHLGCVRAKYCRVINTDDLATVTCKLCLKFIMKNNIRPRSDFPDIPTFDVTVTPAGQLTFDCPLCGESHWHGRGNRFGDGDGHRCSQCTTGCWPDGYNLREVAPGESGEGGC
jgi:hypothetical protein